MLQKVIPRDPLHMLITTEYYCTLYNLAGTLTARQTIAYNGKAIWPACIAKQLTVTVTALSACTSHWCALFMGTASASLFLSCGAFYSFCQVVTNILSCVQQCVWSYAANIEYIDETTVLHLWCVLYVLCPPASSILLPR